MDKITFRPSEQEAGATVIGKLVEKKNVSFKTKEGESRESMVYELETIVRTVTGTELPLGVTLWGTKVLDEQLEPAELGDMVSITYKGKSEHKGKGDFSWTQHEWEVSIETEDKQETL